MMPDRATLQNEIGSILLHSLHVEVSSVHEDLIETGLLDSLKIVELLVELEEHFAIRIPLRDLEIDSFRSLGAITNFVLKVRAKIMPAPVSLGRSESLSPRTEGLSDE
jgi:acyl carrier protein